MTNDAVGRVRRRVRRWAAGLLLVLATPVSALEYDGHLKTRLNGVDYASNSQFAQSSGGGDASLTLEGRLNGSHDFQDWRLNFAWQGFANHRDDADTTTLPMAAGGGNLAADDSRRLFDLSSGSGEDETRYAHRIDRLALTYATTQSVIILGRQALSWGNGLLFNPMDIVNPFDPTAVDTEYKTGDDMAYAQYLFDDGSDLQGALVFRRDPASGRLESTESTLALKYHRLMGDNELDMLAARNHGNTVIGLGGNGLVGEAVWRADLVFTEAEEWVMEAALNLSYSWVWRERNYTGSIEYFHHGFGQREDNYSIAALAMNTALLDRLGRGESFTLGRNYLGASMSTELTALTTLGSNIFINLDDGSGLLQLTLQRSAADNVTLLGALTIPMGPEGSEYGGIAAGDGSYYSTGAALMLQAAWYR